LRVNKKMINILPILLKRLSDGQSLSTSKLSDEFNIPTKTIQDNINKHLKKLYPDNIMFSKSTNQWYSTKNFLSETLLTAEEIITMDILEEHSSGFGKEFNTMTRILFNRFKKRASFEIYKKTNFEKIDKKNNPKFALIKNAINKKQTLVCKYNNKHRIIYPLKIVMFDGYWYALVYDKNDEKIKTFHLKSIENIEYKGAHFNIPDNDIMDKLNSAINAHFNEIEQMKDISQYFSIMSGPSVASTNIGFYKSNLKLENLITSSDKHNLCSIEESKVINFSTSNYLGLGQHEEVVNAAKDALTTYGTGSNGSPILSGYYKLHHRLEKKLSDVHDYDDTILVSSGFMANIIVFTTLFSKDDTVFLEKNSHGSIIMGAKLSGAKIKLFEENDITHLEKLLKNDKSNNKLIVTCGVFSMSGKITNLPMIVKLAKKYNCLTMLDDAHAFGIIGTNGFGTAEYHGLRSSDIDIHVGTLSKSLSSSGGYICAKQEIIRFLRLKALPYILSASVPPAIVAGAVKSLEIIKKNGKELSDCLIKKQKFFKEELLKNNIEAIGDSAIVIIPINDTEKTLKISKFLHEKKIYANGIIPPGVRKGQERIRFNITLTHTLDELKHTVKIIKKAFEL